MFATQKYLLTYPFNISTIIFKLRGRSTNCLANRGIKDCCRLCKSGVETQNHAVNCPSIVSERPPRNVTELYEEVPPNDGRVTEIVERFSMFENALKHKHNEESKKDSDLKLVNL